MKRTVHLVFCLGFVPAACTPAPVPVDLDAAREAIMEADREFARDVAEQGVDGWVPWFAEDGAMIQSGVGEVRGHAAIQERMAPAFEASELTWEPVRADVGSGGDLGYTVGTWEARGPGPDGELQASRGMYVTIWKRQADGSWKIVMDLGNPTTG